MILKTNSLYTLEIYLISDIVSSIIFITFFSSINFYFTFKFNPEGLEDAINFIYEGNEITFPTS